MKNLYTIALSLFAAIAFGQDSLQKIISLPPTDVFPHKGFWFAASYGYNTRSFIADYVMYGETPGINKPRAYLAGNMPAVEVGYSFDRRIGLYASFSKPFTTTHTVKYPAEEWSNGGSGWFGSLGAECSFKLNKPEYAMEPQKQIMFFLRFAINAGTFKVQRFFFNGISTTNDSIYGGYGLGITGAMGMKFELVRNLFATCEADFTGITYKPNYINRFQNGTAEYVTDLQSAYDPNWGTLTSPYKIKQEYFHMNFISFRVGLRYNLFGN